MDLSIFGTDKEAEVEGIWHDIGDARLRIARANNPNYEKGLRKLIRPHAVTVNSGTDEGDLIVKSITTECLGRFVLVYWTGVQDEGIELTYTQENSIMMLEKYDDFKELVANLSQQAANYRTKSNEDIVGK